MPVSTDHQRLNAGSLCAAGCALLALPVLIPLLLVISPILLFLALIWYVWAHSQNIASEKTASASQRVTPEQVCLAATPALLRRGPILNPRWSKSVQYDYYMRSKQ